MITEKKTETEKVYAEKTVQNDIEKIVPTAFKVFEILDFLKKQKEPLIFRLKVPSLKYSLIQIFLYYPCFTTKN